MKASKQTTFCQWGPNTIFDLCVRCSTNCPMTAPVHPSTLLGISVRVILGVLASATSGHGGKCGKLLFPGGGIV